MLQESPAMSMLLGDQSSSPMSFNDTPTQQQQAYRRPSSLAMPTSMTEVGGDGVFDMSNIDPNLRGPASSRQSAAFSSPPRRRQPFVSPSKQNRAGQMLQGRPPQSVGDAIEMRRQMRMRGRGDLPVMDRSFQFQLPPDASVARSATSSLYDDSHSQLYYLDNNPASFADTPSHVGVAGGRGRVSSGPLRSGARSSDVYDFGAQGVDPSYISAQQGFADYDDEGGAQYDDGTSMPSIREQDEEKFYQLQPPRARLLDESPGTASARVAAERRRGRRQASPGAMPSQKSAGKRRRLSIEAELRRHEAELEEEDEGEGDMTLMEQRARKSKATMAKTDARGLTLNPNGQPAMAGTYEDLRPMTEEEMKARRKELQKTITLATGMSLSHKTMINDADIIHSIIAQGFKTVLGRSQHRKMLQANRDIKAAFDKVERHTAANFTALSQKSIERHHLTTEYRKVAKRKNLLRREVLRMRSEAKRVFGIVDAIEHVQEQEARREENEEQMLDFLETLREASKEWT